MTDYNILCLEESSALLPPMYKTNYFAFCFYFHTIHPGKYAYLGVCNERLDTSSNQFDDVCYISHNAFRVTQQCDWQIERSLAQH